MAFYVSSNKVVDNTGAFVPQQFATRATLPTGSAAYMAFITGHGDPAVSTGQAVSNNGYEASVTWYKFLTKPVNYKNETILAQGTVAGGYIGSSLWTNIQHVNHATDILHEMKNTLSMTCRYGGWFSTDLAAYYCQFMDGTGVNKQLWTTFTVSTIASLPSYTSGECPNSVQAGPKSMNTKGVLVHNQTSQYITFSTDTWTSGGFNPVTNQRFGGGAFGEVYSYSYSWNNGSVNKLNWSNNTWTQTSSGGPASVGNLYGKTLITKLDYWYYAGDVSGGNGFNQYNNSSDSWTSRGGQAYSGQSEQPSIMGQDWGYFIGGYNASTQNGVSQKIHYSTHTISRTTQADAGRSTSSAASGWGPQY